MSDKPSKAEILQPDKRLRIGHWSIPLTTKVRVSLAVGGIFVLCGPGGWLLSQFLQMRDVQSLAASRLLLVGLYVVGVAAFYLLLSQVIRRLLVVWTVSLIAPLAFVISLDVWAPKPITISDLPNDYRDAYSGHFEARTEDHPAYTEGQDIAGIPWREGSNLTIITLSPTIDLKNVKIEFSFNSVFVHAAQISHVPDVTIEPKSKMGISSWKGGSLDKDGKPFMSIPQLLMTCSS